MGQFLVEKILAAYQASHVVFLKEYPVCLQIAACAAASSVQGEHALTKLEFGPIEFDLPKPVTSQ